MDNPLVHEPWLYFPELYRGSIFMDIGCNVGMWTAGLKNSFEYTIVVDANPQLLGALVEKHGSYRVRPVSALIGDKAQSGTILKTLHIYTEHEVSTTGLRHDKGVPVREIVAPVITIDELWFDFFRRQLPAAQPSFLKIDIEGDELDALKGAVGVLQKYAPTVLLEIHSEPNGDLCERILRNLDIYSLLHTLRHPYYQVGSCEYKTHYWLLATKHSFTPQPASN